MLHFLLFFDNKIVNKMAEMKCERKQKSLTWKTLFLSVEVNVGRRKLISEYNFIFFFFFWE
jgi:hypothetical protein